MHSALPLHVVVVLVFVVFGLVATTQALPIRNMGLASSNSIVEVTRVQARHWWDGPGIQTATILLLVFGFFSGAALIVHLYQLYSFRRTKTEAAEEFEMA